MLYKRKGICILLFITFLLNVKCKGQETEEKLCKESFSNAVKKINSSYLLEESREGNLLEALEYLEISIKCLDRRIQSVDLKIEILLGLGKYKELFLFVNSLEEKDFKMTYTKEMYLNLAQGFLCHNDVNCREKYFSKSLEAIEKYQEQENVFKEEVFYDLFFIKSKVLSKEEFLKQGAIYMKKYPQHKEFFEILGNSFFEDEQTSFSM
ncbi:hypothetical protein [Flavobacterium sp. HSC-61S13]|uniref:hypothetical protein n=1 Tax=Flavobacterium sp. HSC-61S13 TaxID=2910963 RepID=UPI00209E672C|nr:hypothetical protein [Flavobacterium sp. HSC-61S13]MCP1995512.1 hypothetical protein [Flavobacterium sp. HSC-61S13]